jgi:hypothetical protein
MKTISCAVENGALSELGPNEELFKSNNDLRNATNNAQANLRLSFWKGTSRELTGECHTRRSIHTDVPGTLRHRLCISDNF